MRRLLLLALVALGLAPGTWFRSPKPPENDSQALTFTQLVAAPRRFGEFRFLAAWRLDSANSQFGGYSALAALGNGRLLTVNDVGGLMELPEPTGTARVTARIAKLYADDPRGDWQTDPEAMTRDPATGAVWLAYEGSNFITRFDRRFVWNGYAYPREMRGWRGNSGAEAMVRLRDGRFIVLAERDPWWLSERSPGLLFARDPVPDGKPREFTFAPPAGYRPTDMAELPDGRVAILLRGFELGWPPRFPTKLAVADPAEIRPGGVWRVRVVADLYGAVPSDNYEGIAVEPTPGGGATVWIISDDNNAGFQRTLLLKFAWSPTQKARGSPARLPEIR